MPNWFPKGYFDDDYDAGPSPDFSTKSYTIKNQESRVNNELCDPLKEFNNLNHYVNSKVKIFKQILKRDDLTLEQKELINIKLNEAIEYYTNEAKKLGFKET